MTATVKQRVGRSDKSRAPQKLGLPDLCLTLNREGSAVVAFNRHTGKEVWRALTTKDVAYCAPVIYEIGGVRQLIVWLIDAVHSLDLLGTACRSGRAKAQRARQQAKRRCSHGGSVVPTTCAVQRCCLPSSAPPGESAGRSDER